MAQVNSAIPKEGQHPFSIAIAGGGIGGLALAIGLLHQNVPVHVYEAAPAFAEIGAGVAFGPNSLRAMSLISPSIREGYEHRATNNAFDNKKGTWFDFRYGMDSRDGRGSAGDKIAEVKCKTGQSSVHRAHFLDELVKLIPDGVASFGKRLDNAQEVDEGVILHFSDGTTATHTAVIGCDGIKSRVRQIVLGEGKEESKAVFTGKYAYRGLVPMEKAVALLGDELARNSQMYVGYHGHILTFPIEQGHTMNVVAFKTKANGEWPDDQWVKPMSHQDMNHDFQDWGESVKGILSLLEKPDVWALFNHLPASTYHTGGAICLVGDSAHASTPHQGAGAGMALEDAFVLSRLLGSLGAKMKTEITKEGVEKVKKDISRVFEAFESVRKERTQKLVSTSREAGEIYEFEGPMGDDVNAIAENLLKRYNWIWDEDLEAQLERAKEYLSRDV
jgi:salicylate hydroxylase